MGPAILNLFTTNKVKRLVSINIVSYPNTQYVTNQIFSLSGLSVEALYDDGSKQDVTENVTSNIQEGTVLRYQRDIEVVLTYKENGITKTTAYIIYVTDIEIVTWGGGTDEQIKAMVQAADLGRIDLRNYWTIGDEREVQAIANVGADGYLFYTGLPLRGTTIKLILADYGDNYELSSPTDKKTHGNFIVQYKYVLSYDTQCSAAIRPADENSGDFVWGDFETDYLGSFVNCTLDNWLTSGLGEFPWQYCQPNLIKDIVKTVKVPMLENYKTGAITYRNRQYFLPTETEIFGKAIHSSPYESRVTKQWLIYRLSSDQIKRYRSSQYGISDETVGYWTRSPLIYSGDQSGSNGSGWYMCSVNGDGQATGGHILNKSGILPAFII